MECCSVVDPAGMCHNVFDTLSGRSTDIVATTNLIDCMRRHIDSYYHENWLSEGSLPAAKSNTEPSAPWTSANLRDKPTAAIVKIHHKMRTTNGLFSIPCIKTILTEPLF